MKKFVIGLGLLSIFVSSCSYVAGESASNYIASGGKTLGYVENRPVSSAIAGHGTTIVASIALNAILGYWLQKKENADLRKIAYDCWMNRPKDSPYWNEQLCKVIAEERLERKKNFFLAVNAGKCKNSLWNPFAAFKKCWNEGFTYLENTREKDETLEDILKQVYYDDALISCLPDPMNYIRKGKELHEKYLYCKQKAKEEAQKALKEIEPKLKEYLARKS